MYAYFFIHSELASLGEAGGAELVVGDTEGAGVAAAEYGLVLFEDDNYY